MSFNYEGAWGLVAEIQKMPYGSSWAVPRHQWEEIVPRPDPLRQMMLAVSGHRPETERTPEDWFRFWLNGPTDDDFMMVKTEPYVVWLNDFGGDMRIDLPVRLCPRCHGRGSYQRWPTESVLHRGVTVSATQIVQIETIQCTHEPERRHLTTQHG